MIVLGIDPGSSKVGLAVVEDTPERAYPTRCLEGRVSPSTGVREDIKELLVKWSPCISVLGDRTRHQGIVDILQGLGAPFAMVDEHMTTRLARDRYFGVNPPRGLKRLIPLGMQAPPVPVDDFAAWILAERYLVSR